MGKFKASDLPGLDDGVHHDGSGLYIRKRKERWAFFFRYTIDGKRRQISIGKGAGVTLTAARAAAESLRVRVARGEDPLAEKQKPAEVPVPTLSKIWGEAVENRKRVSGWIESKNIDQWYSHFKTYVEPTLGSKRVNEITRDDVLSVLLPIWEEKTVTASRIRNRLEIVLNYCKARGWRDGENPAAWKGNLDLFLPTPIKVTQVVHRRAASLDELKNKIVPALWAKGTPSALATLFGCLTVLRANEFLRIEWSEIDGNTLTVPWIRMKTEKVSRENFRVPLSRQALLIIERMRGIDERAVFKGRVGRFFERDTPRKILRAVSGSEITMHGMRSVFRDWCASTGKDFLLSEKCLDHAVGSSTVRAYLRSDFLEERRAIMQAWADEIFPMPE